MTRTIAYPLVRELADGWEKIYPSAVCAGIVPDRRHLDRGGYHCSREQNPRGNYSIVRRDDRAGKGPDDAAAAVDMGMNRADMILCTRRLRAVWANKSDPRRKYLNAFNGWLGAGAATRFDMVTGTTKDATPDHKSHVHLEIRRMWIKARSMVRALLSALRGETVAQYLRSIGVAATTVIRAAAAAGRAPVKPAAATVKAPAAPPYPGRVLKRDDTAAPDEALRKWQARMLERGWKGIGKADGRFGPKCEKVVRRFQARCKVEQDGRIGPATWPLPWTRPGAGD